MDTVYLGTSPFAAAVLRALADTPHRPRLVITRPDRPRGRGRRLAPPPVAEAAADLGLTLAQPASVNDEDARAQIAAHAPRVLIVCAFGALIKEPLLSDYDVLNVHPSLLPRWRGAAPVERAIMAGDAQTGVCIMRLTAGLDTGPVALRATEPITATDTYGTLTERLAPLAQRLLIDALDRADAATLSFDEQSQDGITYAEKITAQDRILDGDAADAITLDRHVRALAPHIGCAVMLDDGQRLGVWESRPRTRAAGDPETGVLSLAGERPLLGCAGDSTLELTVVQPAGRTPMDAAAFLRGRR
jgi:methionyl-tRNA formyltransferase